MQKKRNTPPAGLVLSRFGRNHFAFFRGWLEGLDLHTLAKLYLEPLNGATLHERTIVDTVNWIRRDLITLARRHGQFSFARAISINPDRLVFSDKEPTLDEFREETDPFEMYSESELLELFMQAYPASGGSDRKKSRINRLRERQRRALAWLESSIAVDPHPDDPVDAWLIPNLALHLQNHDISTIRELVDHINHFGNRWHARIRNIGTGAAARIVYWLRENEYALKMRLQTHALIRRSEFDVELARQTRPVSLGIVPIEYFQPRHVLDGFNGINRGERNRTLAFNDYEAIQLWLKTVAHAGNTWRSYRKEAERFLLWSILERGKPVSSMLVDDCIAYRDFLFDLGRIPNSIWNQKYRIPQENWLGKRSTERWSEAWRPFERPPLSNHGDYPYSGPVLSLQSQKHAQTVLKAMCEFLTRQRYLDSNPWDGVPPLQRQTPGIKVERSFTFRQWEAIIAYLETKPYDAKHARLRAVLKLGYGTGLRLSEMVSALWADIRYFESSTSEIRGWELRVTGKGMKERLVAMPTAVMAELHRYMQFRGYENLSDIPEDAPIIDRIGLTNVTTESAVTLSHSGLYKTLKTFFRDASVALADELQESSRQIEKASTHWLRHTSGSHAIAKGVPVEVIRDNFGHASIDTTSIYITAETERRIVEMEKLF